MARQNFIGLVVSQGKMNKTVKVRVQRHAYNRVINKDMIKRKDYLVHDEGNICREGDVVRIESTRPLSARKSFAVAEIKRNQGSEFATYEKEAEVAVHLEEVQKHGDFLKNKEERLKPSLIDNLFKIEKLAYSTETDKFSEDEIKAVDELKKKYGITSWPPKEKLVELEVDKLERELKRILVKFDNEVLIQTIVDDTQKLNLVLEKLGKQDAIKKNIQKNLVRKFVQSTPKDELESLGFFSL